MKLFTHVYTAELAHGICVLYNPYIWSVTK